MPKSCNFKGRRSLFILSKALFMSCKTKAESSSLSMPVKMTSVELISAVSVGFLFPLYFPERQLFLVKYFSLHLTVLVIIRSACYHRVIHSLPHLERNCMCLFPFAREIAACRRGVNDVSNHWQNSWQSALITHAEIMSMSDALFEGNYAMICSTCLHLPEPNENCSDNG